MRFSGHFSPAVFIPRLYCHNNVIVAPLIKVSFPSPAALLPHKFSSAFVRAEKPKNEPSSIQPFGHNCYPTITTDAPIATAPEEALLLSISLLESLNFSAATIHNHKSVETTSVMKLCNTNKYFELESFNFPASNRFRGHHTKPFYAVVKIKTVFQNYWRFSERGFKDVVNLKR